MSRFIKVKLGEDSYKYLNLSHVVHAHVGQHRDVFKMVDGSSVEGIAEPLADTNEDDVFLNEAIVQAQPNYSTLSLTIDKTEKVVFLTIAPVVSWRIGQTATNSPYPIALSDEDSSEDTFLKAVETPNGSVVLNGCATYGSREEWFAHHIKMAGAEGFEVMTTDLVGKKTPVNKS